MRGVRLSGSQAGWRVISGPRSRARTVLRVRNLDDRSGTTRTTVASRTRGFSRTIAWVLSRRGDVAWILATSKGAGVGQIWVRPAVARDATRLKERGAGLRLEDGRTLRWWKANYPALLGFHELRRAAPHRCPHRPDWKRTFASDGVLVTRKTYHHAGFDVTAYRACEVASGTDTVLDQVLSHEYGSGTLRPLTTDGRHLAYVTSHSYKAESMQILHSFDLASRREAVKVTVNADGSGAVPGFDGRPFPTSTTEIVFADRGQLAWRITDRPGKADFVFVLDGAGLRWVDTGPAGQITELAAHGPTLTWLHAGQRQSMDVVSLNTRPSTRSMRRTP